MKKLVLISLILVLVSGCSNPFSAKISADYFPLRVGNRWVYRIEEEGSRQLIMEVLNYDSLYSVSVEGQEQLMERKMGVVNIVSELITTYQGDRVSFGKIYEPYLILPFINHDSWSEQFTLWTVYKGDTLYKNLIINIDSVGILSIDVPFGKFDNTYRLKRTRIEDEDTVISYEWFAPNIGLVRKEIPADSLIWELEDFEPNELQ